MDTQNHRPRADLPRGTEGIRTWGAALKYAREKAKYRTPKDLAGATDLSAMDINLWERGMGSPDKKDLRRLYGTLPLLVRFAHLFAAPPAATSTVIAKPAPVVAVEAPAPEPEAVAPAIAEPPPPAPEPEPESQVEDEAEALGTEADPVPFAQAMRELREQEGLKQGPFGAPAGLSGGDISRYERGGAMRQDIYHRLVAAWPALGLPGVAAPSGTSRQRRTPAPAPRLSGNKAIALELAEAMDDFERAKAAYDAAMAAADGASKRQDAARVRVDELMGQMRSTFSKSTSP